MRCGCWDSAIRCTPAVVLVATIVIRLLDEERYLAVNLLLIAPIRIECGRG
jgi:hypothetical protein